MNHPSKFELMATFSVSFSSGLSTLSSWSLDSSVTCIPSSIRRIRIPRPSPVLSPSLKLQKRAFARPGAVISLKMAAAGSAVQEVLPPALTSTSEPPPLFDGTTRLYVSYTCPYAQRVWITRNCKNLQEKIQLVPIDLHDRPSWYKEKVYPANKVPALEHNNEVKGESLDLIKYIDSNFEGPSLLPNEPEKRVFADELISYIDSFSKSVISSFKGDGNEADVAFDYLESALLKFEDGPFFLGGQFSLVDIAYAPFIERYQPFLLEVKAYDITAGRPKLAAWVEEINKIEAYRQTKRDPKELVESYKKRFLAAEARL